MDHTEFGITFLQRQRFLRRYLVAQTVKFRNVFVFDWSLSTIWGGTSLLLAYHRAMEEIAARSLNWDFLINLSESDYPVKTMAQLETFLGANRNKNFVKSSGQSTIEFIRKQGLRKAFVECDEHLYLIGDRELPNNLIVDGGSDWFALSQEFVLYLVTSKDELVGNLLKYFQNSLLPAETFFHMVLQNSRFCSSVINSNLRYTNWFRKRGCRCQHSSVVGWCGCSPSVLRNSNLEKLQYFIDQDPTMFFARKFDLSIDKAVVAQFEHHRSTESSSHCVSSNFDHIMNFYSGSQDRNSYESLASALFTKAATKYIKLTSCVPKSSGDNIDLFVGIRHQNGSIGHHYSRHVVLQFRFGELAFEAGFSYIGRAGFLKYFPANVGRAPLHFKVVSLTVSENYDPKENVFRTAPFLVTTGNKQSSLTLEIQVSGRQPNNVTCYVLFVDPRKARYSFKLPPITATVSNDYQWFDIELELTFAWFQGFDIPRPLQTGLWEVTVYVNNEFRHPGFRTYFLVHPSGLLQTSPDWPDQEHHRWRLDSFCLITQSRHCAPSSVDNNLCRLCNLSGDLS